VCVSVCLSASISVLLRRGDKIPRGRGNFWGVSVPIDNALYNIAIGTLTKTAVPIDMPFGLMTRVGPGPRYRVINGGPPQGKEQFWGLSGLFKSNDNLRYTGRCSVTVKGIIQSPITSCSGWGHSVCQASANKLDYCKFLYYTLSKSQITCLLCCC